MGIINLKNIFNSKNDNSKDFIEDEIRFITTTKEKLASDFPSALHELRSSKLHGFLVKNFLNQEEVLAINENFKRLPSDMLNVTPVGKFYPKVFPELNNQIKEIDDDEVRTTIVQNFFNANLEFKSKYFDNFGVDLYQRLNDFFSTISSGYSIDVPKGFNNEGLYPFGTFRSFNPESGILTIHCGNYFQSEYELIYKDLVRSVEVKDQLSYFVMLQPAENSGHLRVFNLRWKDGMTKPSMMNDEEVITPDKNIININSDSNIVYEDMKPQAGDLILFQGGNIWHKVTRIEGLKSRVTFGGFMGYSKVKNEYLIWG